MKLSFKAITIALAAGLGALIAMPAAADDTGERERAARDLIVATLPASRMPEIYDDLRRSVREVYLPVLRETIDGKFPGLVPPDPKIVDMVRKATNFLNYASRASDETDDFAKANRDAIITDVAQLVAKYTTTEEIENIRGALHLTATRKAFDTFYVYSRLITGFTYEEARSTQEFSAWLNGFAVEMASGQLNGDGKAPPPERVIKAQAIVNDLQRIIRPDDMVADGMRFAREVVVKSLPGDQQAALSAQLDQFEFNYNLQKSVVLAAAPSGIAALMNDEQLDKVHAFVRTPAVTKMFKILYELEQSVITFTAQDIATARAYFEDLEKKGKLRQRSEAEKKQAEAEWEALSRKWSDKFLNALSPETREGLIKSLADLQALDLPTPPVMPPNPM